MRSIRGHFYTLWPSFRDPFRPESVPTSTPWSTTVEDPDRGPVRLTGLLTERPEARALVLVIHGLGGHPDRYYSRRAAQAADDAGFSCLRFAMRGADLAGEDFYHTALAGDLAAAIASPELARYDRIYIIGYSIGGHVALHLGAEVEDPRVRGIAAVCSPLDLVKACEFIDGPRPWFYRLHVLRGLKKMYDEVARRREVPTPAKDVRRTRTFREWDSMTIVPRYGFESVDHYYRTASVAPRLPHLRVPAIWVGDEHDPIAPPSTVRAAIDGSRGKLEAHFLSRGGHVTFPSRLDLGFGPRPGLEAQLISWLLDRDEG